MEGFELACFVASCVGILAGFTLCFFRWYTAAWMVILPTLVVIAVGVHESVSKENAEIREKRQTCEQVGLVYLVSDDVCVDGFRP